MSITPDLAASQDTLQKFIFENASVRGELVDISATWREVQARHDYPTPVKRLLGEMVAAAALLSANLKFNGSIIMQIHGDGPVRLLVVECDADLRLRATAKLTPDAAIADDAGVMQLLNAHGKGRFIITLDPADKVPGQQPYQGIVPLDGDDVATVIENYMQRSEQLDTRLILACNDDTAAGLLLQRLPDGHGDAEGWPHVVALADTLQQDELLTLGADDILYRLYHQETVRVFDPEAVSFACNCSEERVGEMLKLLGGQEAADVVLEQGSIEIGCEYCGQRYVFDEDDVNRLFNFDVMAAVREARH